VSRFDLAAGGLCAVACDRRRRLLVGRREWLAAEARAVDVGLRAAEIILREGR
jgi:hypothetical protein